MPLIAKKTITLAIVDDHPLFRKGLTRLINQGGKNDPYKLLFEAGDCAEMQYILGKGPVPDIIILDIEMDVMAGYQAVQWLREQHPAVSILVLSIYKSEKAIRSMMQYGVRGYLSKEFDLEDIHAALETIANGELYFSTKAMQLMTDNLGQKNEYIHVVTLRDTLSKTELQFLELVCTELTYGEIAGIMSLSTENIAGIRDDLFLRFGVHTRVSLAMYAVKNGLVALS